MWTVLNYVVAVVLGLLGVLVCLSECGPLNDYILDYQPLTYDQTTVHKNHLRVRRSVDSHFLVRFTAFGKWFHVKLWPSTGVFSPKHQAFIEGKGLHRPDTSFIYQGSVTGEAASWVHLAVHNGSLVGEIHTADTTYHIEPAAKYLTNPPFHTIIYPETHLNTDPYRARRQAAAGACGLDHPQVHQYMEKALGLEEEGPATPGQKPAEDAANDAHQEQSHGQLPPRPEHMSASRHKRALNGRTTCPLHLIADPLFFRYFKEKYKNKAQSDSEAEQQILAFFSSHVNAISNIYSNTVFQKYTGSLKYQDIRFIIHKTSIWKRCSQFDKKYCCDREAVFDLNCNNMNISSFLDLTSKYNNTDHCLSFTFTYRDFTGGPLGLAWVATTKNSHSGVCGDYGRANGRFLNTGVVTIINFEHIVPSRVSQLSLAHETGHSFGSPHDTGSGLCVPYGTTRSDADEGNYIMYPNANLGELRHNYQFSPCSRDNITRILEQIDNGNRRMCFEEAGQAYCGNRVTEQGEQCDCGFGDCAPDTCCVGRSEDGTPGGCRLTDNALCSPGSGPCCTESCQYEANGVECQHAVECKKPAFCPGDNYQCPDQESVPDGEYCNERTKVCVKGQCIGSVCQNVVDPNGAWKECFKTSGEGQDSQLCYVACRHPVTKECVSSNNAQALLKEENSAFRTMLHDMSTDDTGVPTNSSDTPRPIALPAGSACDNYHGKCDSSGKCQDIDKETFLKDLEDIFESETFDKIKHWIVDHWWVVVLGVGSLLVMGLGCLIRRCGCCSGGKRSSKRQRQQQRQGKRTQAASSVDAQSDGPRRPSMAQPRNSVINMDMPAPPRSRSKSKQFDQFPGIPRNSLTPDVGLAASSARPRSSSKQFDPTMHRASLTPGMGPLPGPRSRSQSMQFGLAAPSRSRSNSQQRDY